MNVIRECSNPKCMFRYPEVNITHAKAYCPKCGHEARIAVELPDQAPIGPRRNVKAFRNDFVAVLDNIRSIYNAGSIIRTSDGFGVHKLLLCGITPTPQNPRFLKTSLGAEDHVKWEYQSNALLACNDLKKSGYKILALEIDKRSTNLYAISQDIIDYPVALVIGNEKTGIDPDILKLSDQVISIPMNGYKNSYNVSTSYGIAISYLYALSIR